MTVTKPNVNAKQIQDYLIKNGLSRKQDGFYYLTCLIAEYMEHVGPVDLQVLYDALKEQKLVNETMKSVYARCRYSIKNSSVAEINCMGVKEFLCHANDELLLL